MESSRNLLPKGKKSSRILKMSYIKSKRLLTITFNNGATYEYYDVPTEVIDGITQADPLGKYFDRNIKGIYNYRRVVNG